MGANLQMSQSEKVALRHKAGDLLLHPQAAAAELCASTGGEADRVLDRSPGFVPGRVQPPQGLTETADLLLKLLLVATKLLGTD